MFLPFSATVVAHGLGNGRWSMWSQQQAMTDLREVVALAGARAEEYALYSLRIGSATHLSTEGATPEVMQHDGRWASNAYMTFVRSHGKDASWVTNVMAKEERGSGIQPGQDTEWGQVNPPSELDVQSRPGDLSSYHAALVVCAKCVVARSWIVTRVPHGIAEGGRKSANANAFRNRANPLEDGVESSA